jgi:hypothetical protein
MSTPSLIVTIACGFGGLGLSFAGAYWLGMRDAYRQVSRDLMDVELGMILAAASDDDDGIEVLA